MKQDTPTFENCSNYTGLEIAVIGMAGRFPGARDIQEFWANIKNGVESIRFFTDEEVLSAGTDAQMLKNPNFVKARGVLDSVEYFEPAFFNVTPLEAEIMDPQLRIFLECAWHAFEDAGYQPQEFNGSTGVYAGNAVNHYWIARTMFNPKFQAFGQFRANLFNTHFSTRISYHLNLKGPSMTINTACSTSLVAIHTACLALISSECDMALAGGCSLSLPQESGYVFQEGMILSPDGHCRAFDAQAKGTVGGSGSAAVLLKRLEDAIADGDHIYAVVKGTAINNDGYRKVGYTAPSIDGQAEAIRAAYLLAEVDPQTVSYIETHGTATELGDPVEIEALNMVFKHNKKQSIPIGSLKTNVGHLDTAAGAAGFIKTVLALYHRQVPPSLHYKAPNPKIDFANSPFFVNTQLCDWENSTGEDGNPIPLRAGVSSFGLGGTNAHAILEEAPAQFSSLPSATKTLFEQAERVPGAASGSQVLVLSARTPVSLDMMVRNLDRFLQEHPGIDLADVAYTLQVGRKAFPHRLMLSCPGPGNDTTPARQLLSQVIKSKEAEKEHGAGQGEKKPPLKIKGVKTAFVKSQDPPVIFLLSGQGTQYVDMGRDLYENNLVFREEMDHCFEILKPLLDHPLKELLYPPTAASKEPGILPASGSQAATPALGLAGSDQLSPIDQTGITQPIVFIFAYALAKLLMKGGIRPRSMIGYSLGEYIAACLAGVISLEDALQLVVYRGQLMQQTPTAVMLSVPLPEAELRPLLAGETNGDITLAIVNGPSCVVTGETQAIRAFEERMRSRRLLCTPINMGHAVHTPVMDRIRAEFENRVKDFQLSAPRIPYVSNVTAGWITNEQAVDPRYWGTHLAATVRFSDGVTTLLAEENAVLIEIGAGRLLSNIVRQHPGLKPGHKIVNVIKHQQEKMNDLDYFRQRIADLWLYGVSIDWAGIYAGLPGKRYRLSLPVYPFDRKRYWPEGQLMANLATGATAIEPGAAAAARQVQPAPPTSSGHSAAAAESEPAGSDYEPSCEYEENYEAPRDELEETIAQLWQDFLGFERIGINRNFFDINGDSLTATQLITRLQQVYPVEIPLQRFFEEPTIAHLAELTRDLLIEKVKAMSEAELDEISG